MGVRPPARGIPPRAPSRPPPWGLGGDDRPALPVRHGGRRPARGADLVVVRTARAARRETSTRGALPPDACPRLARPPRRGRRAAPPAYRGARRSRLGR